LPSTRKSKSLTIVDGPRVEANEDTEIRDSLLYFICFLREHCGDSRPIVRGKGRIAIRGR